LDGGTRIEAGLGFVLGFASISVQNKPRDAAPDKAVCDFPQANGGV
jgi:hypothetical protein